MEKERKETKLTKLNKGKIYYYDDMIANDLNEFFVKYLENETYVL